MSDSDIQPADHVDNWVFDSLVNFLHGSLWKAPVVGFIEEKSVVFDPDSFNNMSEEKEEEFRKVHEEYKGVVDFMLASFMEDLQVTPEQVEEACRVREHQSKTLPESHITKVALEQLWAAEDFNAFRRLMTRKNIDLQLQSLELLVAKYGVLSPALRSGESEEAGDDGEDDFLQVVIRYSDQLELFKYDYGSEEASTSPIDRPSKKVNDNEEHCKDMKVHLAGIQFKTNVAPKPINYHATLTSSFIKHDKTTKKTPPVTAEASTVPDLTGNSPEENCLPEAVPETDCNEKRSDKPELTPQPSHSSPKSTPSPTKDSTIAQAQPESSQNLQDRAEIPSPEPEIEVKPPESFQSTPNSTPTHTCSPSKTNITNINEAAQDQLQPENVDETSKSIPNPETESHSESQLVHLEETAAAVVDEDGDEASGEGSTEPIEATSRTKSVQFLTEQFDPETAAEIASTASEQRRLLTAVRKALEDNPEDEQPSSSIDMPAAGESDEDLQRRREYLRAQRDKLIAMKKQEREKQLVNTSEVKQSSRPKSARAAQMALKNPNNMRAASLSEKSLSARRALADRLKQELIQK